MSAPLAVTTRASLARLCAIGALLCLSVAHGASEAGEKVVIETHACGCEDQPIAHFPYRLVILKSAQGEIVARPEGTESAVYFKPLALRHGDRYCSLESESDCYGNFAHPCEFSDFRYGSVLAQYFPTCKDSPR